MSYDFKEILIIEIENNLKTRYILSYLSPI